MHDNFSIFILSHGNPNKCYTLDLLTKLGNTNKYYLIVDNLDPLLKEYKDIYPNNLIIFDKYKYVNLTDTMFPQDNIPLNTPLYARCACEDIALELGLKYFCVMDDDVISLKLRIPNNELKKLQSLDITDIDKIFDISIDYLYNTNCHYVCFSSQNLFIGGYSAFDSISDRRLGFNIFIRNTCKKVNWKTIWYDDFNTGMLLNGVGNLTLNIPYVQSNCKPQGSSKQLKNKLSDNSGMEIEYRNSSAFNRGFYCVIVSPSSVKVVDTKGNGNYWPSVNKNCAFPKIISDFYKK